MNRFLSLSSEQKVVFFIGIAERIIPLNKVDEHMFIAKEAINCCWCQIINRKYNGEVLYNYIDNEENGISIFAELCNDEIESAVWNCIIDAIAFTSRYSYDKEKVKFYPEPISLVDDELVEHMISCYSKCFVDNKYIEKLIDILLLDCSCNIQKLKDNIEILVINFTNT